MTQAEITAAVVEEIKKDNGTFVGELMLAMAQAQQTVSFTEKHQKANVGNPALTRQAAGMIVARAFGYSPEAVFEACYAACEDANCHEEAIYFHTKVYGEAA